MAWHGGKAKRKKIAPPEEDAQREIVLLLRDLKRFGLLLFFAVPNQLLRSKAMRLLFWALGCEAGIPDLVILLPDRAPKALGNIVQPWPRVVFIELKAEGGRLSKDQKDRHAELQAFGFVVETVVCLNPIDGRHKVADVLRRWGVKC